MKDNRSDEVVVVPGFQRHATFSWKTTAVSRGTRIFKTRNILMKDNRSDEPRGCRGTRISKTRNILMKDNRICGSILS